MVSIFSNTSNGGCKGACGGRRCLMTDIGSNIGFFGMLAMFYGCEAVFFDVQKSCTQYVQGGVLANSFQNLGRVYHLGISDVREVAKVCMQTHISDKFSDNAVDVCVCVCACACVYVIYVCVRVRRCACACVCNLCACVCACVCVCVERG
jgi:hypothetical protein